MGASKPKTRNDLEIENTAFLDLLGEVVNAVDSARRPSAQSRESYLVHGGPVAIPPNVLVAICDTWEAHRE